MDNFLLSPDSPPCYNLTTDYLENSRNSDISTSVDDDEYMGLPCANMGQYPTEPPKKKLGRPRKNPSPSQEPHRVKGTLKFMWGLPTSEDEHSDYKSPRSDSMDTDENGNLEKGQAFIDPHLFEEDQQLVQEKKPKPKPALKMKKEVGDKRVMHKFFGIDLKTFDGKVILKIGKENAKVVEEKLIEPKASMIVKLKLPTPKDSMIVQLKLPTPKPALMVKFKYRRPSYIVKLNFRTQPIKPVQKPASLPLHPFFQKRSGKSSLTSTPQNYTNPLSEIKKTASNTKDSTATDSRPTSPFASFGLLKVKQEPPPAPLPTLYQMHVRGLQAHEIHTTSPRKQTKKKSKGNPIYIHDSENIANARFSQIEPIQEADINIHYPKPDIRIPKQIRFTTDQLRDLVSKVIINTHQQQVLKSLMSRAEAFSAFDAAEYETQMWASKYAPKESSTVITNGDSAAKVLDWLVNKLDQLKKTPVTTPFSLLKAKKAPKRTADEFDGFIIKSSESFSGDLPSSPPVVEEPPPIPKFLILYGPSGSGKTSAVYAAAAELGAYTFELNPSDKRSSKKLFEKLGGMGKSHLVHRAGAQDERFKQQSVILLDEVDVLFEEDQSFWAGLDRFVETSRRPVIMTCSNPSLLPPAILENHYESFVHFLPAPLNLQVNALWLMALGEGHLLNHFAVEQMVLNNQFDFRSSINDLQFWCQMALGDRRSGINWTITPKERAQTNQNEVRVISHETYIGRDIPEESSGVDFAVLQDNAVEELNILPILKTESLADFCVLADSLADADLMAANKKTLFEANLGEEYTNDRIIGLNELTEFPERVQPYSHELSIYPSVVELSCKIYSSQVLDKAPPMPAVNGTDLRESLWFLSPRVDGISSATYSSVETASTSDIATEIMPQIRSIARHDLWKLFETDRIQQEQQGPASRRMMNRVFSELGLESNLLRKYLDCDPKEILRTAPAYWGQMLNHS